VTYSILVFNRKTIPVSTINSAAVLAAVTESNYQTLCRQYGLDPALIAPARENLRLVGPSRESDVFFALVYGPAGQRPVIAHLIDPDKSLWVDLAPLLADAPEGLEPVSREAVELVRIDLGRAQLADMGLLLAYELARWAAACGDGVVRGLDGRWYRLNRHRAFLPFED
jgi:hypothetical protein